MTTPDKIRVLWQIHMESNQLYFRARREADRALNELSEALREYGQPVELPASEFAQFGLTLVPSEVGFGMCRAAAVDGPEASA